MDSTREYDYIITGAGCAGLSLLMHMIESGKFSDKKILLVDKEQKNRNDRTWCFWETTPGLFEPVVYKNWDTVWFYSNDISRSMDIRPYSYKMIRGADFYNYCFQKINQQKNITVVYAEVEAIQSQGANAIVTAKGQRNTSTYVFNSILFEKPALGKNEYYLLQHFKGWVVETETDSFNPSEAVLMDFRPSQHHGTTFVYVMPFTRRKALVEYTLFTPALINDEQYNAGLKKYINEQLKIEDFKIVEEEYGIIPMTNHLFPPSQNHIVNIGTAGGQTKSSSGYTFSFIQKHSAAIVNRLVEGLAPVVKISPPRFHFYDSVLLNILYNNKLPGQKIFTDLFKKNKPQTVLRFLDNESSIIEDLKIISSLPAWPFIKAAVKQF